MSPPSWTPFPSATPPHASRSSQSARLRSCRHTASSHLLLYTWECTRFLAILSLPPTLSFPYCAYRSVPVDSLKVGSSVPSFWIPYACIIIQYFVFLFLTSLCIICSRLIHLIRTDLNAFFFFYSWVIFHCIYIHHHSFIRICRWTSRLLPCPGYYKKCCHEYWGTCVSFNYGFLRVYAQ